MSEPNETLAFEEVMPEARPSHLEAAGAMVRNYVSLSVGVGVLPVPGLDILGLTGLQFTLLYKLARLYEVPFDREAARSIIGALVGGSGVAVLARPAWSLLKAIPVVGTLAGGAALSIMGGASTYALGRVFIQHFESGGTFLSFDPKTMKGQFARLQEEGKSFVASITGKK